MISIEYFLLYCVVILVFGLGLGLIVERCRHWKKTNIRDNGASPGKLVILLSSIGTDVTDHWEKIRAFGQFLTVAADSAAGSKESEDLEASLENVSEVNRSFVQRTQQNVRELSAVTGEGEYECFELRERLTNHLDHSKSLQKNLDHCDSAQDAISEMDVLLESLEVLMESKKETEAALAEAQQRLKEQDALLQEATFQARSDSLTQIPNRRSFDERLADLLSEYDKQETPFSLIMLDLDHLKKVNDKHGHAAGDAMLVVFARLLFDFVRDVNNVARMGGDEFAILLPRSDVDEASHSAERLQERIEQTSVRYKEHEIKLSASLGVAEIAAGETGDALWDRADKALYRAKNSGGNQYCVSVAETETPDSPQELPEEILLPS